MKTSKFLKSALAVFLVLLFAVPNMTSAYAASKEFVKELRVVYASSPEEAREKLGSEYTLVQRTYENSDGKTVKADCSLTEGSYDSSPNNGTQNVYLAYSTTTNETEAVTDISAMFMNGEFDTSAYDELLEQFDESVQEEVDALSTLIDEYRENYNDEEQNGDATGKAHAAYKYLTLIFDEDYLKDDMKDKSEEELAEISASEKYMSLADVFLDESICTWDYLTQLYVQGNTSVLLIVEEDLAMATGGETTWVERLAGMSYAKLVNQYKKKNVQYNTTAKAKKAIEKAYFDDLNNLYEAWGDLDKGFADYEASGLSVATATEEQIAEKFTNEAERLEYMRYGMACEELKKVTYGDSNLYDAIFNQPASNITENPEDYYVLLSVLTIGEKASLVNTDVISLITKGLNTENDFSKAIESTEEYISSNTVITETEVLDYNAETEDVTADVVFQVTEGDEKTEEYEPEEGYENITSRETAVTVEPVSVHLGIDRDFFKSGVALTKEALNDMTTRGVTPLTSATDTTSSNLKWIGISIGAGVGFVASFAFSVYAIRSFQSASSTLSAMVSKTNSYASQINSVKNSINTLTKLKTSAMDAMTKSVKNGEISIVSQGGDKAFAAKGSELSKQNYWKYSDDLTAAEKNLKNLESLEDAATKEQAAQQSTVNVAKLKMGISIGITCVFAAIMIYSIIQAVKESEEIDEETERIENAQYTYPIAIPERMCWAQDTIENIDGTEATEESDSTVTVTDFFFYNVVKSYKADESGNLVAGDGDIFAKTQKEWIALYTTTDWGCGYPILADSLTIRTGSSTNPSGLEKAVRFFGQVDGFAQNLHDSKTKNFTEADDTNGLYIFYHCYQPKAGVASVFADNMPIILCVAGGCGICVAGAIIIAKKRKSAKAE